jgi:pimeloyl-ACP methyl ester carboxylesterase
MQGTTIRAAAPLRAGRASAPVTFVRQAGRGPRVVCIHANASSSRQWLSLIDKLAPSFEVLAPDCYGAGRGPGWTVDRAIGLADEADLVEPLFEPAPVVLVGHSYGAAVALTLALRQPSRVRALALYEPTLFSLLDAESPAPNDADGIRAAGADAVAAVEAGEANTAARRFIDYWMGHGAWDRTPEHRKAPILASITNVGAWGRALFGDATPLSAFGALDMPVLYMTGGRSTPSALGVARLLSTALPNVRLLNFAAMGHMGPVTHPEAVNDAIADFLTTAVQPETSQRLTASTAISSANLRSRL